MRFDVLKKPQLHRRHRLEVLRDVAQLGAKATFDADLYEVRWERAQ
jgi:hypothetical protein